MQCMKQSIHFRHLLLKRVMQAVRYSISARSAAALQYSNFVKMPENESEVTALIILALLYNTNIIYLFIYLFLNVCTGLISCFGIPTIFFD